MGINSNRSQQRRRIIADSDYVERQNAKGLFLGGFQGIGGIIGLPRSSFDERGGEVDEKVGETGRAVRAERLDKVGNVPDFRDVGVVRYHPRHMP
jgi:hypothetical protein